jgi:hypothetical protein
MLSSATVSMSSASRLTAFRAIFLGFARHGIVTPSTIASEWTLPTLEALFVRFLELEDSRPRENTLFWLVSAVARTSGNDADVLRGVFERVEGRFGYVWGRGRLARIRERFIS